MSSREKSCRKLLAGVFLVLAGAGSGCSSEAPAERVSDPTSSAVGTGADPEATVLLVHGFHSLANGKRAAWNCQDFWKTQRGHLSRVGYRGPVLTAGFYTGNVGCDRNADSVHFTKHFAGDVALERGSSANVLTNNTPMEHAAYRMAWLIASVHAEHPLHSVRIVADSLGGPVVRWLVTQSAIGNPNFPTLAELGLTRVYAYAAPYRGASLASFGVFFYQAQQTAWDSDFAKALAALENVGSAKWISFTSDRTALPIPGDGFISNESACLPEGDCYRYTNPSYFHGTYALDTSEAVKSAAYQIGSPRSTWGPKVDGVGAAALVAKLLME